MANYQAEIEGYPEPGDTVTYRDWPNQPDSYVRTGIVVTAKRTADHGWLITLRHPDKPEVTWTEFFRQHMTVIPADGC